MSEEWTERFYRQQMGRTSWLFVNQIFPTFDDAASQQRTGDVTQTGEWRMKQHTKKDAYSGALGH